MRSLIVAAVVISGCGKGSGGGGGNDAAPLPQEPPPGGPEAPVDGSGLELTEYESDTRDARVAACAKGEPFALETCWSRVVLSDAGEMSLEGPTGRLGILGAGGELAPEVSALYQYSSPGEVISDRLEALTRPWGTPPYWFLPTRMKTTIGEGGAGGVGRVKTAEFPLFGRGGTPFEGQATLCGEDLKLPMTAADVERACKVAVNSWTFHVLVRDGVKVSISWRANFEDTAPGNLGRRQASQVELSFLK